MGICEDEELEEGAVVSGGIASVWAERARGAKATSVRPKSWAAAVDSFMRPE
jgi:hypothetical protein